MKVARSAVIDGCDFGRFVLIQERAWLFRSFLGDHSYVASGTFVAQARVGKFCSIGPQAFVGLPEHPSRGFVSTHPAFYLANPGGFLNYADRDYRQAFTQTTVGNDVWVGASALIKGGLTIGDGAIIGAGAIVTHDVAPYSVVVGIPARHMRYRFDAQTIAFLINFKWWDRDEKWLKNNFRTLHDIDAFVKAFKGTN